jgi:hypothetical protein
MVIPGASTGSSKLRPPVACAGVCRNSVFEPSGVDWVSERIGQARAEKSR